MTAVSSSSSCSRCGGSPVAARMPTTSATSPGSRNWPAATLTLTSGGSGVSRSQDAASAHDQAGLLGGGDEPAGQQQPLPRVFPPDQRLDRVQPAVGQPEHRLVVHLETA